MGTELGTWEGATTNGAEARDCLEQYYRCRLPLSVRFTANCVSRTGHGFFQFGRNTTCFGSYYGPQAVQSAPERLYDCFGDIDVRDGTICLPFNPYEIAENLRWEKYAESELDEGLMSLFSRIYYLVRPTLSSSTRKCLQKIYFRNAQSIAFPSWPVDCSVDNLHENLLGLCLHSSRSRSMPFIWFWPEGASSCAMMTHDVETETGRDFCPALMDIDDAYGIKASFQIVPEKRYTVSRDYLDAIRERDFEVAIHDLNHDGLLYRNRDQFLKRAAQIGAYRKAYGVEGFRAAILYRKQTWYDAFDFSYDMSVPNVGHLDPQRGGCCTVMPYFVGNILELPLTTTQDYTLFRILNEHSIDLWKRQMDIIMEKHGLMSFLVHPDYLFNTREQDAYESLLRYLALLRQEKNVWITTPGEVNRWWRRRAEMRLVENGGTWRIEGPDHMRARVAYANLINGRVIFTWSAHSNRSVPL